ncbi:MAG: hypothetical protein DRH51_01115 [Candidatus Coatesbacteria bacterium]|nr:MAG: hypothetical protein DRH51_01115 [Candidatus Coatesbacteria bacterium]
MKFKYLVMERFKRFREPTRFSFTDGINVVYGPNESGKSTTLLALETAMFKSVRHTKYKPESLISWGTDRGWILEVGGETEKGDFAIKRNFSNKSESIKIPSGEYTHHKKILEGVGEILTFTDESILTSTILIRQGEMLELDKSSLSNQLKAVITGGVENIDNIIKKAYILANRCRKDPRTPEYIIKETEENLYNLKNRRDELSRSVNTILQKRTELQEMKKQYKEKSENLKIKEEVLEKNRELIQKRAEQEEIKKKWEQYKKFKEDKKELMTKKEKQSEIRKITPDDIESIRKYNILLKHSDKTMAGFNRKLGYIFSIAGVISLGFSIISGISRGFHTSSILAGLLGGILLIGGTIIARMKGIGINIAGLENEIKVILKKYNEQSVDDFEKRFDEQKKIENEIKSLEDRIYAYTGGLKPYDYEKSVSGLDLEYSALDKEIEELKHYEKTPEEFAKLENDVIRLKEEVDNLKTDIYETDGYIKGADINPDDLTSINEQIAELENVIKEKEYEMKVYKGVYELLSEANREVSCEIVPKIEKEMSNYINLITDDRYHKVSVDEEDLNIRVYLKDLDDFTNVDELSHATKEQFYLVERVAIGDHLTGDKNLPLLLDDPFVHFDEKRFSATMDIIKAMSERRQIIIFTCHDRYNKWADNIIELQ